MAKFFVPLLFITPGINFIKYYQIDNKSEVHTKNDSEMMRANFYSNSYQELTKPSFFVENRNSSALGALGTAPGRNQRQSRLGIHREYMIHREYIEQYFNSLWPSDAIADIDLGQHWLR